MFRASPGVCPDRHSDYHGYFNFASLGKAPSAGFVQEFVPRDEKEIGKPNLTDLQEAKKTLLVWYAYYNSGRKDRLAIKNILGKHNTDKTDLLKIRQILLACGALEYTKKEIANCLDKAGALNNACRMKAPFKKALHTYSQQILKL